MKRCQVLPFGSRLNRKCDQLIDVIGVYPFHKAFVLLEEAAAANENIYLDDGCFSTNYVGEDVYSKEAINLGIIAQINGDNIYYKSRACIGYGLLILAADLHEASIIFSQLLEEIGRLTHKSTLKV